MVPVDTRCRFNVGKMNFAKFFVFFYLFIYSFIYLFIYLFVYLFIYLLTSLHNPYVKNYIALRFSF